MTHFPTTICIYHSRLRTTSPFKKKKLELHASKYCNHSHAVQTQRKIHDVQSLTLPSTQHLKTTVEINYITDIFVTGNDLNFRRKKNCQNPLGS